MGKFTHSTTFYKKEIYQGLPFPSFFWIMGPSHDLTSIFGCKPHILIRGLRSNVKFIQYQSLLELCLMQEKVNQNVSLNVEYIVYADA